MGYIIEPPLDFAYFYKGSLLSICRDSEKENEYAMCILESDEITWTPILKAQGGFEFYVNHIHKVARALGLRRADCGCCHFGGYTGACKQYGQLSIISEFYLRSSNCVEFEKPSPFSNKNSDCFYYRDFIGPFVNLTQKIPEKYPLNSKVYAPNIEPMMTYEVVGYTDIPEFITITDGNEEFTVNVLKTHIAPCKEIGDFLNHKKGNQ